MLTFLYLFLDFNARDGIVRADGFPLTTEVIMRPKLYFVGKSSFRILTEIFHPTTNECLGRVWGLLILVNRKLVKPAQLPGRELLQSAITNEAPQPPKIQPLKKDIPADAYVWSTLVRATDCDNLGHLNNTKFLVMAEEALGLAHRDGAFKSNPEAEALATIPLTCSHIEFIGELFPYEQTKVHVW